MSELCDLIHYLGQHEKLSKLARVYRNTLWQIAFGHRVETQAAIEIHQFRLRVHIERLLAATFLDEKDHNRTGKPPATVFVQHIDRIDLKAIGMT